MADDTESLSVERATRAPGKESLLFLVVQGDRPLAPGLCLRLGGLAKVRIGRAAERCVNIVEANGAGEAVLGLADNRVSSAHCTLTPVGSGFLLEDQGSKNGTVVNGHAVKSVELHDGDLIEVGRTFLLYRAGVSLPAAQPRLVQASGVSGTPGLATLLPALAAEFSKLSELSRSRIPILVRGESGTGKELAAAAVHALSGRAGAFVPVNCGALTATLLAAELFGHRKGAFTGALEERPGLVRAADKGTLFLDEIADLPMEGQTALLRTLQESSVLPLGATRAIAVDLRVVVATHRDLEAMVAAREFRGDLLARLTGFTLRLPPLRDRREDLGILLAGIFQRRLPDQANSLALGNGALRALFEAHFPLNVRELEKTLVTAAALSKNGIIEASALPEFAEDPKAAAHARTEATPELEQELLALLRKHQGNITAVAAELGKARVQVRRWLKKFAIDPQTFRAPDPGKIG